MWDPRPDQNPVLHTLRVGQTPTSVSVGGFIGVLTKDPLVPFDFFSKGRVTVYQAPLLRSLAFSSSIPNFRGLRQPGQMPDGSIPTTGYVPGPIRQTFDTKTKGSSPALDKNWVLTPLEARGGSLQPEVVLPVTAVFKGPQFPWFPNGRILLGGLDFGATGALSDFEFWTTGDDPTNLIVDQATNLSSGSVGNDWTRHYAVVVPPAEARYMAVGGYFASQPNGNAQSIYAVQTEILPLGTTTPTSYTDPREIRTILRPDRLNWSPNPSFINNTAGWTGVTRTANAGAVSGFSGNATVANSANLTIEHTVPDIREGLPWLVKVHLERTGGMGISAAVGGAFDPDALIEIEEGPLGTVDITILTSGDVDGSGVVQILCNNITGSSQTVKVHSVLVEETEDATREFFDGNTPGDYFWETGQTDGSSRSYYYKNFLARYKTIKGILADDAPMGVGIADPEYAVSPTN